jgi:Tol biopolymer transport system component
LQLGPVRNLGPAVNTYKLEYSHTGFSDDGLTLAFVRQDPITNYSEGLLATRATLTDPWEISINYGKIDMENVFKHLDIQKCCAEFLSPNALEVYFPSDRSGGQGGYDIWYRTRETINDDWGPPQNLGNIVNTTHDEGYLLVSPNGLELYFCDSDSFPRPGGFGSEDIWVTKRGSIGAPWQKPKNLGNLVNSSGSEGAPFLSSDGLYLFFHSKRPGGYGGWDLYMTKRAGFNDPWEKPVNIGPWINSPAHERDPQLSKDGSTLYWCSRRPGGYGSHDIWQVQIIRWNKQVQTDDKKTSTNEHISGKTRKEVMFEKGN